jgi:phosphoribosylamine---glycine ligase
MSKRILVLGSGGREHAILYALKRSEADAQLFAIPGNGGISQIAEMHSISLTDFPAIADFARKNLIDFTIVGPEQPLVEGIVDFFKEEGLPVLGPDRLAAQLEGSKAFSKAFMEKNGIPTARFQSFTEPDVALAYLENQGFPLVVKASGLAAGKGVIIAEDKAEAEKAIQQIMQDKAFGEAGSQIVIEEFLSGTEMSVFVLTDGKHFLLLPTAQDHKRALDNDEGLNTGGMGAYSPSVLENPQLMDFVNKEIVTPTLNGIAAEGGHYSGFLYIGLMLTSDGPKVLEYNVRLGDPEAQVILPRIQNNIAELFEAAIQGKLDQKQIQETDNVCMTVIMASGGYPGDYIKGFPIEGLDKIPNDVTIYHAGTKQEYGRIVTSGGRVLALTALGENLGLARKKVYEAIPLIRFQNSYFRKDIALKAMKISSKK